MRAPVRLSLALLAALVCATAADPCHGQRSAAKAVFQAYNGTLDEALAHATERNVPAVLVAVVEDEQGHADDDVVEFRGKVIGDAKLAELWTHALVIVACNQVHKLVEIEVEAGGAKSKKQVCSIYRTEGCAWHQKQFDSIYREYNVEGELKSPSVIVLLPDRSIHERWQTGDTKDLLASLTAAVTAARAKAGEGLTELQYAEVTGALQRAQSHSRAGDWGSAWLECARVLAITQKTRQADAARSQQALELASACKQRDEALAWLKGGRALDGYKRLLDLAEQSPGTPLDRELVKAIKAAESAKESKDAIAAYKREMQAETLWTEIEALVADRDEQKAEPKVRVLLRKYADTPAGKRARERFPQWAADEDAKKRDGGG